MERCKNYLGSACVDGRCPATYAEDYAERDIVRFCEDCPYYKGCEDCPLEGTDYCNPILGFYN